jgi:hypothetical protein
MPLTPSGKIDRRALPAPDVEQRIYAAPSTGVERALVAAWQSVLGVKQVGVDDNFYELGGDSILSVDIIQRLRLVGLECSAGDFFRYQTIAELSAVVGMRSGGEA